MTLTANERGCVMANKYRVFTEVKVIIEKEITADSASEAHQIAQDEGYTKDEVMNGNFADDCVTSAENTSTGEMFYFI